MCTPSSSSCPPLFSWLQPRPSPACAFRLRRGRLQNAGRQGGRVLSGGAWGGGGKGVDGFRRGGGGARRGGFALPPVPSPPSTCMLKPGCLIAFRRLAAREGRREVPSSTSTRGSARLARPGGEGGGLPRFPPWASLAPAGFVYACATARSSLHPPFAASPHSNAPRPLPFPPSPPPPRPRVRWRARSPPCSPCTS